MTLNGHLNLDRINDAQAVFTIFFAIFWGFIGNVQPKWKAFHWPHIKNRKVVKRLVLSAFLLNFCPVIYFASAMHALSEFNAPWTFSGSVAISVAAIGGAFAIFSFYHFWIGIVEYFSGCFYDVTTCWNGIGRRVKCVVIEGPDGQKVPVGDSGLGNIVAGAIYFSVGLFILVFSSCLHPTALPDISYIVRLA